MKRNYLILALAVIMLMLVFTGCKANNDTPDTTTTVQKDADIKPSDNTTVPAKGNDDKEPTATTVANDDDGEPSESTTAPVKEPEKPTADTEAPVISIESGKNLISVVYGTEVDLLDGVTVSDNKDANVKITVSGEVNNKVIGTYVIKYNAVDESGNKAAEVTKTINVLWNSPLTFIGHAGCYYGIMNTEEAFNGAVTLGYQAIECDVKQTSDGVFVMSHDDTFGGKTLNATTYADLKDVEYTLTRGDKSYSSKICTFEKYLQICKENNMTAVIELKASNGITNSDQSRMPALMQAIENAGMLDKVIFLGSQYNCLIWVKQNGYADIPCQYLVSSIESDEVFNRCVTNNLDISFDISYTNSKEWITKYRSNGIKVACYTFNQYKDAAELQKWIDLGVDFVTCDKLVPADVTLPVPNPDAPKSTYTVNFKDMDGTLLKTVTVTEGNAAAAPSVPAKTGYKFTGWNSDISYIVADTEVTAQFTKIEYTISYNKGAGKRTTSEWENKNAFINDFYSDYFTWLSANVNNISSLTKSGDTYTMKLNDVTVTFKNAADIMEIDKYDFEKTLANFIYAPVTRVNDTTPVEPAENAKYFLNSSAYRIKYCALDAYFLNACINGYSAYDRNYSPTSNGRIQIFFRFHQWAQGTSIRAFNTIPYKTAEEDLTGVTVTMPQTPVYFTVEDEIVLANPTVTGGSFLGWYTTADCTGTKVTKIAAGTANNIVLYAKISK